MNKQKRARQIILYAFYITSVCCLQVTFSKVFCLFGRTADLMLVFVALAEISNKEINEKEAQAQEEKK